MSFDSTPGADRRRLELALQAASLGEFEWDAASNTLVISERMSAITGIPAGNLVGQVDNLIASYADPQSFEAFLSYRDTVLKSRPSFDFTLRLKRKHEGQDIWLRLVGMVERDEKGASRSITGVIENISRARLGDARRVQLMAEMDHRVKNVLATVQALAQQTARRTTSLAVFMSNFGGRLKAMASANELLTAARWRGAAIDHIAAAELGALAPGQTSWDGPDIFLTPRAANALSLAFHELTANAVKFGALSQEGGQVSLRWTAAPAGGFDLTWTESGGPTVTEPFRQGFGAVLLSQVTGRELNGSSRIEYRPAGVVVSLHAGPQAMAERPDDMRRSLAPRIMETIAASSSPPGLTGARVLIVEDAVLLALELQTGLSEAGAMVVGPAYELEEALELVDQPIDIAVLDANLNGRSVTPVAEALARRGIPFIFATGYGDTGAAPGGFDAPVIRKPYDVRQVATAVADLLARDRATSAATTARIAV